MHPHLNHALAGARTRELSERAARARLAAPRRRGRRTAGPLNRAETR
jgi:hypothetical protein